MMNQQARPQTPPEASPQNPQRKRRRFRPFQFGLRAVFVLMAITAVWAGFKVQAVHRQQAAVTALAKIEVVVHYDHQHSAIPTNQLAWRGSGIGKQMFPATPATTPGGPRWLRAIVGDDYFQTVTAVTLHSNEPADIEAVLPHLKKLPHLKEILLHAPSCGFGAPPYSEVEQLLQRELPGVEVTGFAFPMVG